MKTFKLNTEYVIQDGLNEAIITVNEVKKTNEIRWRSCKDKAFKNKVEAFSKTVTNPKT